MTDADALRSALADSKARIAALEAEVARLRDAVLDQIAEIEEDTPRTDRPIIFSTPMVRALLEGRKTQTRLVLKPQPEFRGGAGDWDDAEEWGWEDEDGGPISVLDIRLPYITGDRLWVREAIDKTSEPGDVFYRADYEAAHGDSGKGLGWRPSIHMPRWASRLTLTVTDVRVQRLHDISLGDCYAEGCTVGRAEANSGALPVGWTGPWHEYRAIWNSLHGPGAWDANPWVAALTFTVEKRNIDSGDTP